jgi:ribosomal protein S18 acetylase RimI-like enzyme
MEVQQPDVVAKMDRSVIANTRPVSTSIRVMTRDDIIAAMRLKNVAGWNQTQADWLRFLSASPDGCFVAERDGSVVGTAASITYEGRFAWIGMVIVAELCRAQGIGNALLRRVIEHLDSRSIPCIRLDATPEGKAVYAKLGFVNEFEIERWMLNCARTPSVTVTRRDSLKDVLRFDKAVFGADRSALLTSMSEMAPEFTHVARNAGEVSGYIFGRRGSYADQAGPWVARTEEVAEDLLNRFLRQSRSADVFVDVLPQNLHVLRLLRAHGFVFSRPLTRMFRGANKHPGRSDLICAVAGPEFG